MSLLLLRGSKYYKKFLKYGPLTLWPLWEMSGSVAQCLTGPAFNGQHVGVTLGQVVTDSKGVTFVCPFYDGANDYTNVWSATYRDSFNGSEGTALIWARVFNAGVWTDGQWRRLYNFEVNATNRVHILRTATNNTLMFEYTAGGVVLNHTQAGMTTTDFFKAGITWSKSADEVRCYLNGAQVGPTLNGLGVWAGLLNATTTLIGAMDTTPQRVWHGWEAFAVVFNRALSQPQIQDLATP